MVKKYYEIVCLIPDFLAYLRHMHGTGNGVSSTSSTAWSASLIQIEASWNAGKLLLDPSYLLMEFASDCWSYLSCLYVQKIKTAV